MNKTYIIAEMAWAHDGSINKAIDIMKLAKDAGANAVGVHVTDLPTYMVPHYGSGEGRVSAGKESMDIYKYLEDINISYDDWITFNKAAVKENIDICVMPNDARSLDFCESKIKVKHYVLSAASFVEKDFIIAVAKTGKPTIFRVGGATVGEIENALNLFNKYSGGDVTLLHGFQNYPTKIEDTNLLQMESLHKMFGVPVGLADHIDGGESIAKVIPIMALSLGASCIEKHITWNRDERGEDFEAALNPSDFKEFVSFIRAGEVALGKGYWGELSDATIRYREVSRKRMVAARDICASQVINRKDIAFKRSDHGMSPKYLESIIGRVIKVDLRENEGINLEDLV